MWNFRGLLDVEVGDRFKAIKRFLLTSHVLISFSFLLGLWLPSMSEHLLQRRLWSLHPGLWEAEEEMSTSLSRECRRRYQKIEKASSKVNFFRLTLAFRSSSYQLPCHAPMSCPEDEPCTATITILCQCGNLQQRVSCGSKREKTLKCNE